MHKLTRNDLRKKLEDYAKGRITLKKLNAWKDKVWQNNYAYDDWEGDTSFINEVLHRIEMQDVDGFPVSLAKKIVYLLDNPESTNDMTKKLYSLEKRHKVKRK